MSTQIGIGGANIYTADGSLTAARTLTLATFPLTILGTTSSRFFANGNVGIGTTTDAGFKLDVNGTARVSGQFTATNGISLGTSIFSSSIAGAVSLTAHVAAQDIVNISYYTGIQSGGSGIKNVISSSITFSPIGGTAVFNQLNFAPTINQTGGSSGITRGLFINPNLTAAADFRAIETTVGKVCLNTTSGNTMIGTTTDAGYKLDVNGTARVSGELTVFKGLTASGRIATFYGFQSPYQWEASIEVGMQSTDEGVALIGGSNIQNNRGGFLQTKNGQRAISWNVLGIVSIGTPQITSSQYSALSIGGGQAALGLLVPDTTGVQLAVLSKAISHSGSASTQAAISFNSFASSSLIANLFPTTYTDAYNVYIAGPPTAGNNVTFTNTYALYVNSGKTYLGGNTLIGTTTDAGFKLDVNGTARVSGILTLSTSGQITSGTNSLIFTSTGTPSRVMSWDAQNSNIDLLAGGFGEGYFLGNRLALTRTATTFVSPDALNAVGSAKITAYDAAGNVSIQASNNGNRSIVLRGLGATGAVLIGNITTGNGTAYSAILQADSTTQGFLPPRMTNAQRLAIATPAIGLIVYCTDVVEGLYINKSTGWTFII